MTLPAVALALAAVGYVAECHGRRYSKNKIGTMY